LGLFNRDELTLVTIVDCPSYLGRGAYLELWPVVGDLSGWKGAISSICQSTVGLQV